MQTKYIQPIDIRKCTKKIFLLTIVLFITHIVNAQDNPVSFGIKAGINMSNITSDLKGKARFGLNAGLDIEYNFQPDVFMLTGLTYSMEGRNDKDGDISLSYLKLPVHFGYKIYASYTTKLVFHIGPYMSYAVDGKYKTKDMSVNAFNDEIINATGFQMNRFDFGVGLAVGVEFSNMSIKLGYDLGVINRATVKDADIFNNMNYLDSDDINAKNLNVYLTLGYRF